MSEFMVTKTSSPFHCREANSCFATVDIGEFWPSNGEAMDGHWHWPVPCWSFGRLTA